jgi:hypothetical protein
MKQCPSQASIEAQTYNPSIQKVRQEGCKFEASLGHIAKSYLKKQECPL